MKFMWVSSRNECFTGRVYVFFLCSGTFGTHKRSKAALFQQVGKLSRLRTLFLFYGRRSIIIRTSRVEKLFPQTKRTLASETLHTKKKHLSKQIFHIFRLKLKMFISERDLLGTLFFSDRDSYVAIFHGPVAFSIFSKIHG